MSLRIRPLRLEALECRLAPASMSSLLHSDPAGLALGHSLDVPSLDDTPRGLMVAAMARGLSQSSFVDVNVSVPNTLVNVSIGLAVTPGSGTTTVVFDLDVSVGKGKGHRPVDVPPVDVPPVVVPPVVVPPVIGPPVVVLPPVVVPPVVVSPVHEPPINEPSDGGVTGPAEPAATPNSSAPQVLTGATPNAAATTAAAARLLLPVNLAAANQAAATSSSLSQSPATPFLFLSPTSPVAPGQSREISVAVPRANVLQEADLGRPQKQTFDFAVGGGDTPEEDAREQLLIRPMVEPRGNDPEFADPAMLNLEAASPELGVGGRADATEGEEDGALVLAGFVGEGGLPSWLIFALAVSSLALARLAVPMPRRRYYDHLLLAEGPGRYERPE
jgi:hypothetical protein